MELFIWPITVLIMFSIIIVVFYKPLRSFLERINSLKLPYGIESSIKQDTNNLKKSDTVADEILKVFDNQLMILQEQRIRANISLDKIQAPDDKIKVLLKYLTGMTINALFEKAYYYIYGTQIQLLESINSKPEGELKSNLKMYFDKSVDMQPIPDGSNYDSYLNFLKYYDLIEIADDRIKISLTGREFLAFLIHAGKNKEKYF